MITANVIPANLVGLMWDEVVPLLELSEAEVAREDMRVDVDTYLPLLRSGERTLIVMIDDAGEGPEATAIAVCIVNTQLDSRKRKVLIVGSVGGIRFNEWVAPFQELIERIARAEGCHHMTAFVTRSGWRKIGVPFGWEPLTTTYTCMLGETDG